jgi:hypothetical protein
MLLAHLVPLRYDAAREIGGPFHAVHTKTHGWLSRLISAMLPRKS